MSMTPYTGETLTIANIGTTPQERAMETSEFKMAFSKDFHEFVEWFNETHNGEINEHMADYASHKADYAAHNGFVGQYQDLPNFTDFNELTTPGLYHGVISGEKLNEAVTAIYSRRITLQVTVNTAGAVYQELYYQESGVTIMHRRFYRQRKNPTDWLPWFEIKTSIDIGRDQGSPEGSLTASVGTIYQRTDVGELYLKRTYSGNTGWTIMYNPTNITVSTSAPSSALAEGFQHQVY